MNYQSVQPKLLLLSSVVNFLACLPFLRKESADTRSALQQRVDGQVECGIKQLRALACALVATRVTAVKLHIGEGLPWAHGAPDNSASAGFRAVPNPTLGGKGQANHYEFIGALTEIASRTAAVFLKNGGRSAERESGERNRRFTRVLA